MKVGFIGLGNMARAMIGGMQKKGIVKPEELVGSAKTAATRERMAKEYDMRVVETNREVAVEADVLILAVKPQFLAEVIAGIKDAVRPETLLISVVAGKSMAWIEEAFDRPVRLVRCMPNTPALVGEGCTGICFNDRVSEEERRFSIALAESFGKACVIPETMIDVLGAVCGSSPAYVFMFIEAMADAGVAAGMPRVQAYELSAQAVYGSAKLMLESGRHPGELKDMVCSPGGTTIQGVRVLEEQGMRAAVMNALAACIEKTRKL